MKNDWTFAGWRHKDNDLDKGRIYYLGGYYWRKNTASGFRLLLNTILVHAPLGPPPGSIFTGPLRGTHPSGTARIGDMVDINLKTEVEGLYVCDASVFPEALDRPTVLTIIGLGKRLSKHLTA